MSDLASNSLNTFFVSNGQLQGNVIQLNSPNFNTRSKTSALKTQNSGITDISLLVIHNISLPPNQFGGGYVEQFFQNKLDVSEHEFFKEIEGLQVSAHLFISREGVVTQFVNFNDRAWHAGVSSYLGRDNCNDFSIGIELEGADDVAYTEKQYATLVGVSLALEVAYPAINTGSVTGHSDIAPSRKTDPGASFDWLRYKKLWDNKSDI